MIVCKVCGNHNEDTDTFCTSCQTFLEWDGVRIDPAAPNVVPAPEAPSKPGLIERVKAAVGLDSPSAVESPSDASGTSGAGQAAPTAAPPQPPAAHSAAAAPAEAAPDAGALAETARRAVAMSKPADAPRPPAPAAADRATVGPQRAAATAPAAGAQPAAQPPAPARRRPPPSTAGRPELNPGDLICGQCGVGNPPARKFCRSCGALLAEAVVAHVSWWRRVFRRRAKSSSTTTSTTTSTATAGGLSTAGSAAAGGAAGVPPSRSGAGATARARESGRSARKRARMTVRAGKSLIGRVARVGAVLGVVGVAGLTLAPWHNSLRDKANHWLQNVRQKIHSTVSPTYESLHPLTAVATSSQNAHPAALLIDGADNTYWAEGTKLGGTLTSITIKFDAEVDIDRIGFRNGSSDDATIEQPRRPEHVRLLYGDAQSKPLTLKDVLTFQRFSVSAHKVTSIELVIDSVYGPAKGHASAITEIEFFRKK